MERTSIALGVVDLEVDGAQIEKSSIGCYVYHNGRLLDVMVISELEQKLELFFNDRDQVIQIIVKQLGHGETKYGSVSIESGLFLDTFSKETNQIWITLFDHLDDDLYDGDFSYNDAEKPRILLEYGDAAANKTVKTSHRVTESAAKGSEKKKAVTTTVTSTRTTTRVTTTSTRYQQSSSVTNRTSYQEKAQFEIGEEPANSNGFDIRDLEEELRSNLQTSIEDLNIDQENRHGIEDERVSAMNFLENAHQELKGEHAQDLEAARKLDQLSQQVSDAIKQSKADINAQIDDLNSQHKEVDGDTKTAKTEITSRTKANEGLQATIDIPEDLSEQGFSEEARKLRKENSTLKNKFEQNINSLVKESHDRDEILEKHSQEVSNYNDTVYKYYNLLLKAEQAKKIHEDSVNEVKAKLEHIFHTSDQLDIRGQVTDIDIESLQKTAESLRRDLESNQKVYGDHTNELSDIIVTQNREINTLKDSFNNVESAIKHLNSEVEKQKVAVSAYETEMDAIKAIGFEDKVGKLQSDLKRAEDVRQKHQGELENAQEQWSTKMQMFKNEEAERRRNEDKRLAEIAGNLDKLAAIQGTINDLLRELDALTSKKVSDDNKDQVQGALNEEINNISLKLRWATEERDNTLRDLEDIRQLIASKRDQIRDQEDEIARKLREIQELRALLEEKKRIIEQLERDIQLAIEEIERLKAIIEELDRRIALLQDKIAEKDAEIAELHRQLGLRDLRLNELIAALDQKPAPVIDYKAVRGDEVDEMLAQYLIDCPVPVKRLGGGFYLFGTRKIYAKIMNGKLVVRVGGGYMFISEFIATYSEPEIIKLTKICEQYGVESIWDLDLEEVYYSKSPGNRNSPRGSPKGGDASPSFSKSKKGKTEGNAMNGSMRQKAFNSSAIVRKI